MRIYLKKLLPPVALLLSFLIFGSRLIAQQNPAPGKAISEATLLDSLDYCSKYTLQISAYHCFTRSKFDIEVYKDEKGYYILFCNTYTLSLSPDEGYPMKYARIANAQFDKLREFEMNLNKGHEHKEYCRGTIFVDIVLNDGKKHFQHCGCGSNAYLEIKNILLQN